MLSDYDSLTLKAIKAFHMNDMQIYSDYENGQILPKKKHKAHSRLLGILQGPVEYGRYIYIFRRRDIYTGAFKFPRSNVNYTLMRTPSREHYCMSDMFFSRRDLKREIYESV